MRYWLSEAARMMGVEFRAPAKPGDAGYDIQCHYQVTPVDQTTDGEIIVVKTGLHIEIPEGYFGRILDRSSLAMRSIFTVGGVIDSGYRGELTIGLINNSGRSVLFECGERIAQIVIIPCHTPELEQVSSFESLSTTERGSDGFGSTGK